MDPLVMNAFRRKSYYGRRPNRSGPGQFGAVILFVMIFVSLSLLVLSRMHNPVVQSARGYMTDWLSPLLELASVPAGYVRRSYKRITTYSGTIEEVESLRRENQRLRQWEWRARRLEGKIAQLRGLLNAVDEPALRFATARVIADGRSPFVRSMLVNVGHQAGVQNGYAVINGLGLVGRTVDTGASVARILLLTDFSSRIPVLIGTRKIRAVLVGDNTPSPRLDFLPASAKIYDGEAVFTSGHGGQLPRGLRIGIVQKRNGVARVETRVKFKTLEYVSVLFFKPRKEGDGRVDKRRVRRSTADSERYSVPLAARFSQKIR